MAVIHEDRYERIILFGGIKNEVTDGAVRSLLTNQTYLVSVDSVFKN